jgi:hypothetical protein
VARPFASFAKAGAFQLIAMAEAMSLPWIYVEASIAVRNSGNGKEEAAGAQVARNRAGCRSLHSLQS